MTRKKNKPLSYAPHSVSDVHSDRTGGIETMLQHLASLRATRKRYRIKGTMHIHSQCPPSCTLAFSRPTEVGQTVWEFSSSTIRDVRATRSCLLYAGRVRAAFSSPLFLPLYPGNPSRIMGLLSPPGDATA